MYANFLVPLKIFLNIMVCFFVYIVYSTSYKPLRKPRDFYVYDVVLENMIKALLFFFVITVTCIMNDMFSA
jgi:hypothetical protein